MTTGHDHLVALESALGDLAGLGAAVQALGVALELGGADSVAAPDEALSTLGVRIRSLARDGDTALEAFMAERRAERGIVPPGDRKAADRRRSAG